MDVKPIRTAAEHRAALAEIDTLMDARPGTADGDRLDVLATLVEAYERTHHPIDAPDPVSAVRAALERRGWGQSDLARLIGRSRASELLRHGKGLSMRIARVLHHELGVPAASLLAPLAREPRSAKNRPSRSAAA